MALVIASHLTDIHGPAAHPAAVALAVREFSANGEDKFSARYFAAFVKRSEKVLAGRTSRVQVRQEERFITETNVMAERAKREEADSDAMLADFEREHANEYAHLVQQAEASLDPRMRGMWRAPAVKAAVVRLVRERRTR